MKKQIKTAVDKMESETDFWVYYGCNACYGWVVVAFGFHYRAKIRNGKALTMYRSSYYGQVIMGYGFCTRGLLLVQFSCIFTWFSSNWPCFVLFA